MRRSMTAVAQNTAMTKNGSSTMSMRPTVLVTGQSPSRQDKRFLGVEADGGPAPLLRHRRAGAARHGDDDRLLRIRSSPEEEMRHIAFEGDVQHLAFHGAVHLAGAQREGLRPNEQDGGISHRKPAAITAAQPSERGFDHRVAIVGSDHMA